MFEDVARQFGLPTVEVPAAARTPEAVLRHLVARLAADGLVEAEAVEATVGRLLKREAIASTGVARGIALPHCKTTAVAFTTGAVGRVPHGVAWGGVDPEPVTAVCLLLCSDGGTSIFMRMLEAVGREAAAGLGGREGCGGRGGMTEQEWLACTDPRVMLRHLGDGADPRKLRLFACACVRRIWPRLRDEASRNAVLVAEAYAEGRVGANRLAAAREEAAGAVLLRWREWMSESAHGAAEAASAAADVTSDSATDVRRAPHYAARALAWGAGFSARRVQKKEHQAQANLLRCFFGTPWRADQGHIASHELASVLAWNDGTVRRLAEAIYQEQAWERLPILADALEEAGCTDADILSHCRRSGPHVRNCWVADALLRQR